MNNLDTQYQELLQDILENGVVKTDRTSTGTKSVFGRQIRHKMSEGFPLLTTKRMAWKTMVTELLWFLQGDTNIKYLVDNGCHIWDGDAYKNYLNQTKREFSLNTAMSGHPHFNLSKEDFISKIKSDEKFANHWGDLGPIYGKQWRKWQGWMDLNDNDRRGSIWYDQIQRLLYMLKTEPDSRRLMVNAWNVAELDQMVLPPCHYGFQVYTRELSFKERRNLAYEYSLKNNKLPLSIDAYGDKGIPEYMDTIDNTGWNIPKRAISLMWNQRSVDTFLGLPFNIASYGLLLKFIAKEVNMVPDELIGNLGDTHLYLNHIEQAIEQKSRKSYELPWVELNFEYTYFDGYIVEWNKIDLSKIELINYLSQPGIKAPLSN